MARLGAIFAGGAARRFGGDKHAALVDGRAMIDHVAAALAPQCDAIVAVGLEWPGLIRIDDLPASGLGPLGALAGALSHAARHGFVEVLTAGCDLPDIPRNLIERLAPANSVVKGQPLLGLWNSGLADRLLRYLAANEEHAMRGWIVESGARIVAIDREIANINTRAEMAAFLDRRSKG